MSNTAASPSVRHGRCERCAETVSVEALEEHRTFRHPRLRQGLAFSALCPTCGERYRSLQVTLFSGRPIEYRCANGHDFNGPGLWAGPRLRF
jgi:hypothetical protein